VGDLVGEDVVGLTERAIGVDPDLGNDEKGEALGTGGGFRCPGEHQVDDVVDQIVVAAGNEDLLSGNGIRAVVLFDSLCRGRAYIRTGLGLGQAHGSGPLPGVEFLHVEGLLLVRSESLDHRTRASGEHEGQGKRHIGSVEELVDRRTNRIGQPHASEFRARKEAEPATLADGLVNGLEGLRQGDLAVVVFGSDAVSVFVAGPHLFLSDLEGLVEHHLDIFGIPIGEFFRFEHLVEPEPVEELELDIAQIYSVIHDWPPWIRWGAYRE
jgi:hypothetical protein